MLLVSTMLPFPHHANGPPDSGGGGTTTGWASFIGIVICLCGNMIISFALNIQRLAHERIQRKVALRQQQQLLRKTARQDRLEETYGSRPPSAAGTGVADGEHEEGDEGTRYLHSTLWWTGLVLMVIGEAGNFVACTYPFYHYILPALSTIVAVMSSLLLGLITLQLFTLMLQGFEIVD